MDGWMHRHPHAFRSTSLRRSLLACSARRYRRRQPGAAGPRLRKVELVCWGGGGRTAKLEWGERTRARERGMSTTDHKHDEGRDVRTGSTFAAVVFGVLATDSSATGPSSLRVVRVLWGALEFMVVVEEESGWDGFCGQRLSSVDKRTSLHTHMRH